MPVVFLIVSVYQAIKFNGSKSKDAFGRCGFSQVKTKIWGRERNIARAMKPLLILLQLTLALPVLGQDYYVAPSGGDGNPGSQELPFATLQRAQQALRQQPAPFIDKKFEDVNETLR